ncbi:PQ loop repeat protein [Ceratocystis lukuohia]|uniref:PQ loop repeat protein n=1 Tax=Ceratocystis lukuohia TaxID=2019550 RepID=A0ABR4MRQ4_9PEZI
MDVPAASNVLGTLGAVCWSIQLIPQIVINYRRHHATGLQPAMMMLWAWAGVPLGVYNIVEDFNLALKIQPQILTVLSLITWAQCFYYQRNWSILRSLMLVTPIAALMGGIEAALIIALRIAKDHHVEWPLTLMAVASAVLLALGVLSHYVDIWRHRTVRGISFIFVGIDAAGDIFSLLSVLFQPKTDVLGIVIYASEFVLWCGVFACGGWYNLRPWIKKKLSNYRMREKSAAPSNACATAPGTIEGPGANTLALHDMPSSTSVFTTTGAAMELRERRHSASIHSL